MLALSALQGISAIGKGYAQSAETKYNASLYGLQAQSLQVQGDITQGQFVRKGGELAASQTAGAAAKGLMPTGSYAAAMLDTQTQVETDMAIARYNTQMGINQANQKQKMLKQQAAQEVSSGYSTGFSDMLKGFEQYGMYKTSLNLGPKPEGIMG